MNKNRDAHILLFGLAALNVIALLYVSWEMCRLSTWIVHADHVWGEMDRTGHGSEHYAAESFHVVRGGLVGCESIVGIAFLTLLWRCLFPRPTKGDAPLPIL